MSRYFIVQKADAKQAVDQKWLLYYLQKVTPSIQIEAALIVTVPNELDCLIQSLDGIPMASQVPPVVAAPKELAKKIHRRTAKMICSQCKKEREQTNSGICKPCAMSNARVARQNGKQIQPGHVGSAERKINQATRIEPAIITRHGPIKGKKLA